MAESGVCVYHPRSSFQLPAQRLQRMKLTVGALSIPLPVNDSPHSTQKCCRQRLCAIRTELRLRKHPFAFIEEFAGDALQARTGFKVDWILRFQRNPMIIEPVGKNMGGKTQGTDTPVKPFPLGRRCLGISVRGRSRQSTPIRW